MTNLPNNWCQTTVGTVTMSYENIDPLRQPDRDFSYIDIGSIDNTTQIISSPKTIKGADAPSRARRVVKTGDTVFSTVRPYLKNVALVPPNLGGELTSTGISVLRPSSAIVPEYLFAVARSDAFISSVSGAQDGTMYPAVSDNDVMAAPLPLPPKAEQQRIVAKLASLSAQSDRARDQLDHVPRLVEKYKAAVVETAIGGELTREWRFQTAAAEWHHCLAVDLFTWSSGKNLTSKAMIAGPVPVIGGNGTNGFHKHFLIDRPTIVIGRVGAQCGNVHLTSGPAWITDNAIYAKAISHSIELNFALILFRQADLNSRAGGSGQPYVNQKILDAVAISLPGVEEQREIVRRVESAFAWINRLATRATCARKLIDHLDQAILSKAFRGELVAQDPDDEPASMMLERIKAEDTVSAPARRGRGRPRVASAI